MFGGRCFMLLVLALIGSLFQTTKAAGTCHNLTQTDSERLLNPCVYVVDYPFYLPSGYSLSDLRNAASSKLNSTVLPSLSSTCVQSIVRYVCSIAYKKCDPTTDPAVTSSYNKYIYSNDTKNAVTYVGLPFLRPCVSVCWDVSSSCAADPLFKLTSLATTSCYSKSNYAGVAALPTVYTFDLKNDATKCYTSSWVTLAGPTEIYKRNNTPCLGLVNEFYSVPGYKLNDSYTSLQLPYAIQDSINEQLSAAFDQLPIWMTSECRLATKQYFCRQYFLNPQPITVGSAVRAAITRQGLTAYSTAIQAGINAAYPGLLTDYVTIPSYPNRSICTDYTDVCYQFRLRAKRTALEPDCYLLSDGLQVFPVANQTISTRNFPLASLGTTLVVNFNSDPATTFYYNETEYVYSPTCPYSFSTYSDPDEEGIRLVTGSACAVACRVPIFTASEWEYFNNTGIAVTIVSIFFSAVSIILIVSLKDWQDSSFMLMYAAFSIISSSGHLHLNSAMEMEQRYCHDKVTGHHTYNGPSPCTHTAIVSSYLYWVGCLLMLFMSIKRTLYARGQQSVLSHPAFLSTFLFVVFVIPLAPMIGAHYRQKYGFGGISPWCGMDLGIAQYLLGFPSVVVCFFTYVLWIYVTITRHVLGQVVYTAIENTANSPTKQVEMTTVNGESNTSTGVVALHESPTHQLGASPAAEKHPLAALDPFTEEDYAFANHPIFRQLKADVVLGSVIVVSVGIYLGFILLKFGDYERADNWTESFKHWAQCVFTNFDGTMDYEATCGTHPNSRATIAQVNLYMICLYANMLFIGPVFIGSYIYAYFRAKQLIAEVGGNAPAEKTEN